MLPKKIVLNKRFCEFLRDERKQSSKLKDDEKSADKVAKAINKSQGWLAQIERGRLKTIKKADLIDLYMHISGKSKEIAIDVLNDQIQFIEITEKKNLINSEGEILNLFEFLEFQQTRGHLQYAGNNLRSFIPLILSMSQSQIEAELKQLFSRLASDVIGWIIRAFSDMKKAFSDEISQPNLFISIKLALDVYNNVCLEYGLDKIEIDRFDMNDLKNKLSNPCIIKEETKLKDINEYNIIDINFVIKHFSFEEYMLWKNKKAYLNITSKMPICLNSAKLFESAKYIEYDDIPSDLSNIEYLRIIRHLYEDLATFYGKLKYQMELTEELQESISEYEQE